MTGKRKLSNDDRAVWRRVADTVTGLKVAKPADLDELEEAIKPIPKPQKKQVLARKSPEPPKARPKDYRDKSAFQLDGRMDARFTKGKLEIDAKLDLHGMTLVRARATFQHFVQENARKGARVLLVVTGKGRHISQDEFHRERSGVIRQSLPSWCHEADLRHLVLKISPATKKHGGIGAYYVYLRRQHAD